MVEMATANRARGTTMSVRWKANVFLIFSSLVCVPFISHILCNTLLLIKCISGFYVLIVILDVYSLHLKKVNCE